MVLPFGCDRRRRLMLEHLLAPERVNAVVEQAPR